jgi:hypothetical protein
VAGGVQGWRTLANATGTLWGLADMPWWRCLSLGGCVWWGWDWRGCWRGGGGAVAGGVQGWRTLANATGTLWGLAGMRWWRCRSRGL